MDKEQAVIEGEPEIIETEEPETEELETEDKPENEGVEEKSDTVQDDHEESEGEDEDGNEDDEVVVSIGEEAPPPEEHQQAPEWVRELRKQHRELQRKNRELEEQLQAKTETKPVKLGAKPTLEDYDYDAGKYEAALTDWFEQKRLADAEAEESRKAEEAQKQAWQEKLDRYGKEKSELKVRDYEDAESVAQELFSVTQQGIVLQGADSPALVIYALGKNPKKAKEIADITDPVKFAFAVAKLEKDLKVSTRKPVPPPERKVSGTAPVSGSVDSTLEKLRSEAEKTGDYTKVIQYKRQKKEAK